MLDRANRGLTLLAALALGAIVGVTLYDISIAAITGRPYRGVYDIVQTLLATSVFFALPSIFRNEGNIRVDLIDAFVSARVLAVIQFVARVATLAFVVGIAWAEIAPMHDAWMFGDILFETGLPKWVIWGPIIVGSVVSCVMAASTFRDGGARNPAHVIEE